MLPFLLLKDPELAIQVSNRALVLLLFIVGYRWGHYTDAPPWRVGLLVMFLGAATVLVAVALGG
ncbi:hypothetical protein FRZ44_30010 [Hypericibacter terrae]|uniref:Uncharacterized protein n=1 Tax=Hypericibacter terrae TaxID=2602015 RepID=A0A5J6MJP9_9PROT|nr:hypothetical protein FRZ44_30010 [Hypericibacter terrae]